MRVQMQTGILLLVLPNGIFNFKIYTF